MKISPINNIRFTNPKINFEGRKKDDGILYGADYSTLTIDDYRRERTIPQIKSAKRAGEDISEDRERLILSRIPIVVEDAENFVKENPQFELDDVIQDLILLMVQRTNSGIENPEDYRDVSGYARGREWQFEKKLRDNALETSPVIEQYLKVQEEEREPRPIYEDIEQEVLREEIPKTLNRLLTPRQKEVVEMIYGLGGKEAQNQRQVAQQLGIFGTRVSECKLNSFEKLSKSDKLKELKD